MSFGPLIQCTVGGYGAWAVSSKNQCTFTLRRVVEKNGYFTVRLTVEGGGGQSDRKISVFFVTPRLIRLIEIQISDSTSTTMHA